MVETSAKRRPPIQTDSAFLLDISHASQTSAAPSYLKGPTVTATLSVSPPTRLSIRLPSYFPTRHRDFLGPVLLYHVLQVGHSSLLPDIADIQISYRLDRLLLLLDTGSSSSVRNTAAKQLAQLAVKSVTSNVALIDEDSKSKRQQATLRDKTSWAELMAVVARVCAAFTI
jgi:hypothetical protein